ncbi:MAG: hypothetical protein A2328_02555 [Bdellovibrionales bacterium RIFOXYB2_FULL_36_6]|nr:MAG: hypothetical protein A2328_02555 [Bdellovibrionales bacterium RIFOXYB2_FULL_36_6]
MNNIYALEETVQDRFARAKISTKGIDFKDLEAETTNCRIVVENGKICVAYFKLNEVKEGITILRVQLYDVKKEEMKTAEFDLNNMKDIHGFAIMQVLLKDKYISIELHDNPSFSTTMNFDYDLKYLFPFYGKYLAMCNDWVIYKSSQVHGMPTHHAEVALFNMKTGQDRIIYPMKPYQKIRQNFIDQNNKIIKALGDDWRMKHDVESNAELFDNYITESVFVNEQVNAFVFVVIFERSNRYPPECKLDSEKVVYFYRNLDKEDKIEYKEMHYADVEKTYPGKKLSELLTPKILKKIFAQ